MISPQNGGSHPLRHTCGLRLNEVHNIHIDTSTYIDKNVTFTDVETFVAKQSCSHYLFKMHSTKINYFRKGGGAGKQTCYECCYG